MYASSNIYESSRKMAAIPNIISRVSIQKLIAGRGFFERIIFHKDFTTITRRLSRKIREWLLSVSSYACTLLFHAMISPGKSGFA